MHAVTSACARGEIGNCGCDTNVYNRDTKNQFQWGGCSHNPEFGARFAKEFVDSKESAKSANTRMNLWNNEAGRQVSWSLTWIAKSDSFVDLDTWQTDKSQEDV